MPDLYGLVTSLFANSGRLCGVYRPNKKFKLLWYNMQPVDAVIALCIAFSQQSLYFSHETNEPQAYHRQSIDGSFHTQQMHQLICFVTCWRTTKNFFLIPVSYFCRIATACGLLGLLHSNAIKSCCTQHSQNCVWFWSFKSAIWLNLLSLYYKIYFGVRKVL